MGLLGIIGSGQRGMASIMGAALESSEHPVFGGPGLVQWERDSLRRYLA